METQVKDQATMTHTAISKDGTTIAYEKMGDGPTIISVNGALAYSNLYGEKELAVQLADKFSVIFYDRRGRGSSTDTTPYAVEREVEDIEALVDELGGRAQLYGSSGGAALALHTAGKLGPGKVTKLALFEPPYESDSQREFAQERNKVRELISDDKPGDAVAFFMAKRGMSSDQLEAFKKSPQWNELKSIAHTLVYDFEVLGDGTIPMDVAKNIAVPTLLVDGEKSFDFVHATADTLGSIIPGAVRMTIKDQTHNVSPEAIAPVLTEFFLM